VAAAGGPGGMAIRPLLPGDRLIDALARLAGMSEASPAAVVLQVSDGEVAGDSGLTGAQAAALATAVNSLTLRIGPAR
jgi:hypothetical protein